MKKSSLVIVLFGMVWLQSFAQLQNPKQASKDEVKIMELLQTYKASLTKPIQLWEKPFS